MHSSQHSSEQNSERAFGKSAKRNLPPVPTGTFAVLPLALWARLWSRRSLRRVATGMRALRLVKVFANDA